MRGEIKEISETKIIVKKGAAAALVIDPDGNVAYRVVSTWWSSLIILALTLMLAICAIVALVVFLNYQRINELEEDKSVESKTTAGHSRDAR